MIINLKEIGIDDSYIETNLKTIEGRLAFGRVGELVTLVALKNNVIRNFGYTHTSVLYNISEKDPRYAEINAINGDVAFTNFLTNTHEFIDVKNSSFISVRSFNRFRRDGWYFLNAFTFSKSRFYWMVRANDAFHKFVEKECEYKIIENDLGTSEGYLVNWWDLPDNPETEGIELYKEIDPDHYHNMIYEVRKTVQSSGRNLNKIMFEEDYSKRWRKERMRKEAREKELLK